MNDEHKRLTFLEPMTVRLKPDASGHLEGTVAGAEVKELRARAAYPFSHKDEFIELRDKDGAHVGMIRQLGELDEESRVAIEQAVSLQHFVPLVKRVISVRGR